MTRVSQIATIRYQPPIGAENRLSLTINKMAELITDEARAKTTTVFPCAWVKRIA